MPLSLGAWEKTRRKWNTIPSTVLWLAASRKGGWREVGTDDSCPFTPNGDQVAPRRFPGGSWIDLTDTKEGLMTRKSVQPPRKGSASQRSWGEKPAYQSPLATGACRWRRGGGTKESIALLPAHLAPLQGGVGEQTGAGGGEQPVSMAHSILVALKRTWPGGTGLVQVDMGLQRKDRKPRGWGQPQESHRTKGSKGLGVLCPAQNMPGDGGHRGQWLHFPRWTRMHTVSHRNNSVSKRSCLANAIPWGYRIDCGWSLHQLRI